MATKQTVKTERELALDFRDWIAAQVLINAPRVQGGGSTATETRADIAEDCYRMADAMLKARG